MMDQLEVGQYHSDHEDGDNDDNNQQLLDKAEYDLKNSADQWTVLELRKKVLLTKDRIVFPRESLVAVQSFKRDRYSDCFLMETYIERGRDWLTKIL